MKTLEKTEIYFDNPYWSNTLKMSYLQRRIIVHSILYYKLNESVIDDFQYDGISRQLIRLISESSDDEIKQTTYYYCMYDFDGTTGFDLYDRLNKKDKVHLLNIAYRVLDCYMYRKYERTEEALREGNDKLK